MTEVDIANLALTKLGAQRISSLADENKQARAISQIYDITRDAELKAHRWNFATKRASLDVLVETPVFGFSFFYELPSDFLDLIQVGEIFPGVSLSNRRQYRAAAWAIEGTKIACNFDTPLLIRYIASIKDPNVYDPTFIQAFACRLAMEVCEELTQSNQKIATAQQGYLMALRTAIQGGEAPPEPLGDDSWILSRC